MVQWKNLHDDISFIPKQILFIYFNMLQDWNPNLSFIIFIIHLAGYITV